MKSITFNPLPNLKTMNNEKQLFLPIHYYWLIFVSARENIRHLTNILNMDVLSFFYDFGC